MTVQSSAPLAQTTPAPLSRRALLRAGALGGLTAALGTTTAMLGGCGDGSIVSALTPSRFISFGDGLSDVGQGGVRYTINDGTINTWADRLANRYGKTLTAQAAGGLGFARGHGANQPAPDTISSQIDRFLASNTFGVDDVVLLNLPMASVLGPVAAVKAGTLTEAAALTQIDAAGVALSAQVKRLIAAGAKHVVTAGVYDLGKSPFGIAQNQVAFFTTAAQRLNDAFKTDAVNLGTNLLFVDAAFLVNRNVLTGPAYGFVNFNTAICTTANASTCNSGTLLAGATATQYVFADGIHLTPACNQQLGDYAYEQIRARW